MTTNNTSSAAPTPTESPRESHLPTWLRVLFAPLAMAAAALTPLLIILVAPGLIEQAGADASAAAGASVAMGLATLAAGILLTWVLMRFVQGRRLRDAGWLWTRRSLPLLLLGMGLSALVVFGLNVPLALAGIGRTQDIPASVPLWVIMVGGFAGAFLSQGVFEELIMRGYLMNVLRRRPAAAAIASGLLFAVLHLASRGGQENLAERFLYLLIPLGFGFAAAALVILTRSLWPAIGIHSGMHVANLFAGFVALSYGPPIWIATGTAYLVIGVIALVLAKRKGMLEREVGFDW